MMALTSGVRLVDMRTDLEPPAIEGGLEDGEQLEFVDVFAVRAARVVDSVIEGNIRHDFDYGAGLLGSQEQIEILAESEVGAESTEVLESGPAKHGCSDTEIESSSSDAGGFNRSVPGRRFLKALAIPHCHFDLRLPDQNVEQQGGAVRGKQVVGI